MFKLKKEAAQAHMSLHLSKFHIVGNLMFRLKCTFKDAKGNKSHELPHFLQSKGIHAKKQQHTHTKHLNPLITNYSAVCYFQTNQQLRVLHAHHNEFRDVAGKAIGKAIGG